MQCKKNLPLANLQFPKRQSYSKTWVYSLLSNQLCQLFKLSKMLLLEVPTQKPAHTSTNTHTHMLPICDHVNEHVIRFVFLCISHGSKGIRQWMTN